MTDVGYDERHRLINQGGATLNGRPAWISGARNDFAMVTDAKTGLGTQWSWQTVKHVIDNAEGKFYT